MEENKNRGFRPLTGTLLSKQESKNMMVSNSSFRPLTGTLLSKPKWQKEVDFLMQVSVPSRGLSYLNELRLMFSYHASCFRPLTGTLLSKHHPPILPPQAAFFAGLRGK